MILHRHLSDVYLAIVHKGVELEPSSSTTVRMVAAASKARPRQKRPASVSR